MPHAPIHPKQRCEKCRGWYDRDVAFRLNPGRYTCLRSAPQHRVNCIGCEQTARDTSRHKDPFIEKARWTARRHAKRLGMKKAQFVAAYGWDTARVAHRLRHDYENTCAYCRRPYATMLNGVRDITMDIIDPAREPFLETNTIPCCQTCNSSKRDLPPDMWARKLKFWREWEANRLTLPAEPVQSSLWDLVPGFDLFGRVGLPKSPS